MEFNQMKSIIELRQRLQLSHFGMPCPSEYPSDLLCKFSRVELIWRSIFAYCLAEQCLVPK